jgi:hypothetical protein
MSCVVISKVGSQMRIQWTEQVEHNSELKIRWVAAIERTRAFSKIALFEYVRRISRLNVLLLILELENGREEANDFGAKQASMARMLSVIALVGIVLVSFALDFLLIWPNDVMNTWGYLGPFFVMFVASILIKAWFARERGSALRAIQAAILEFEEVSGARFSYYDLELLYEEGWFSESVNRHERDELGKRRAELAVNVKESLVERIEVLDNEIDQIVKI